MFIYYLFILSWSISKTRVTWAKPTETWPAPGGSEIGTWGVEIWKFENLINPVSLRFNFYDQCLTEVCFTKTKVSMYYILIFTHSIEIWSRRNFSIFSNLFFYCDTFFELCRLLFINFVSYSTVWFPLIKSFLK